MCAMIVESRRPLISASVTPASLTMFSFLSKLTGDLESASKMSSVRLEGPVVFASSTSDISNAVSGSSEKSSPKNVIFTTTAPLATSDDCSGKKGYSLNLGTSSPSPILRDTSTNVSHQESLSNHSQHVCHTSADQDNSADSPISLHYCSSPDRSSPVEGSSSAAVAAAEYQSYNSSTSLPAGLQPFPSALQLQYQQSIRSLHHHVPRLASFPFGTSSANKRQPSPFIMLPETISATVNKTAQQDAETAKTPNQRSSKFSVRHISTISKSPSPSNSPITSTQMNEENSSVSATPHGIENILSRPLPRSIPSVTSSETHPQSCSSNQYPSSFPGLSPTTNNLDFPNGVNPATIGLHSPSFGSVYWPSLQTFIDNPALQAWRDRFQISN